MPLNIKLQIIQSIDFETGLSFGPLLPGIGLGIVLAIVGFLVYNTINIQWKKRKNLKEESIVPVANQIASLSAAIPQKENVIEELEELFKEEVSWSKFQIFYNQISPQFISKLKSEHPNLSNNDSRLCAFFAIELSHQEIARLIKVLPSSVRMAKYRLKQKLDIGEEQIETHLRKFI